jgi:hypothetical protein
MDDEGPRAAEGFPELGELPPEQGGEGGVQLGAGEIIALRAEWDGAPGVVADLRVVQGDRQELREGERAAFFDALADEALGWGHDGTTRAPGHQVLTKASLVSW